MIIIDDWKVYPLQFQLSIIEFKTLVGIGEMVVYNEIHTSNVE